MENEQGQVTVFGNYQRITILQERVSELEKRTTELEAEIARLREWITNDCVQYDKSVPVTIYHWDRE